MSGPSPVSFPTPMRGQRRLRESGAASESLRFGAVVLQCVIVWLFASLPPLLSPVRFPFWRRNWSTDTYTFLVKRVGASRMSSTNEDLWPPDRWRCAGFPWGLNLVANLYRDVHGAMDRDVDRPAGVAGSGRKKMRALSVPYLLVHCYLGAGLKLALASRRE
ncbi:hypothetical protein C8R47DRAFT_747037 [Mycena vitilis]|nr:hypothetical protein C8R47DRAFT_747037 [Mycena vitilis]